MATVAIAVMVVLTPLGLLAPGTAFGEDAPNELAANLGLATVPAGMARYADFWRSALFPDYLSASPWTYMVSAVVGIVVVGLIVYVVGLLAVRVLGHRAASARS